MSKARKSIHQSGGDASIERRASDTVARRPGFDDVQELIPGPASIPKVELGPGGIPHHSPSEPASGLVTGIGAETEASGRTTLVELPSSWLERLIALGPKVPVGDGVESALRLIVQAVAAILPDYCVGARVASQDGVRRYVYSEPPASIEQPRAERLFPDAQHERVVDVASGIAWLHVAGDDPQLVDERSPSVLLVERAATVAEGAIQRVRAHDEAAKVEAELKALKSYMVQAEKLASLGQMAAGMVHELNNPLTSIVAYSDYMLRHTTRFEEPDVERIRRIAESANRMLRFTRDLVSYARPSSEVPVPVPLHDVINRALAFCEHEIDRSRVEVVRVFDARVTVVRGRPEELVQIFVNLVTNACHAMAATREGDAAPTSATGDAPRLTVTTELVSDEAAVRVLVEDTGHGIAAPNLPLVFAPFFTTKGAGHGTGLGLSIVKNIVETHHGEITAYSEPGRGARFAVRLPIELEIE